MLTPPLVVNCCHCRWCQRESGASFAVNAPIEADRIVLLSGTTQEVLTPSESGYGQRIHRCPKCWVTVWSHYAGSGPAVRTVRVGTLDDPDALPPMFHVHTASKQPWVTIPPGVPQFPAFYDPEVFWPPESRERRRAILPQIQAWLATRTKMAPDGAHAAPAVLAARAAPAAPADAESAGDEAQIRALLAAWARATREGRPDDVLARHAPGARIFDVLPPLAYDSAAAYRASWGEWQPRTQGAVRFELRDLVVSAGSDVAFAHGLIDCGGTLSDGRTFADVVRATFCLSRRDGCWQVVHQHVSKPLGST
jgi:ketosteroid isomerase-like protein